MWEHKHRCLNFQHINISRYVNITWYCLLNVIVCECTYTYTSILYVLGLCECVSMYLRVCVHLQYLLVLDLNAVIYHQSRWSMHSWSLFWRWIIYNLHTFCGTSFLSTSLVFWFCLWFPAFPRITTNPRQQLWTCWFSAVVFFFFFLLM